MYGREHHNNVKQLSSKKKKKKKKKWQWGIHLTPAWTALYKKTTNNRNAGEGLEKRESSYTVGGM